MTNRELSDSLGLRITSVRMKLYSMGLKRMELEYWTEAQIKFLRKNYEKIGDCELAEIFEKRWRKNKGWTNKHIEKKRRYLGLKRTEKQKQAIQQRNIDQGRFLLCPVKRWATTGQAKEGTIRMWREQSGRYSPRIKIKGKWIHWNRWYWQKKRGRIPKRMNIAFKDNDPTHRSISNLILITRNEMARRNSLISSTGLSDNYVAAMLTLGRPELRSEVKKHPELIEAKRMQLQLNRKIKSKQNGKEQNQRSERSSVRAA